MNIPSAYSLWAPTYDLDDNRTRDLDGDATRTLLASVSCRRLVELGCGTGKNTQWLRTIADTLLAMDVTPAMIRKAQHKAPGHHVTFALADLTKPFPCRDTMADWVVANLVLEHIETLSPVFAEVSRILAPGGRALISELHPFRQYQGKQAVFKHGEATVAVPAFVHHLTDFIDAAQMAGLALETMREWWHADDLNAPPRLVTFIFTKAPEHGSG